WRGCRCSQTEVPFRCALFCSGGCPSAPVFFGTRTQNAARRLSARQGRAAWRVGRRVRDPADKRLPVRRRRMTSRCLVTARTGRPLLFGQKGRGTLGDDAMPRPPLGRERAGVPTLVLCRARG